MVIDNLEGFDNDNIDESDGFIRLRKLAQRQTVLIARMGAEQGLGAPISFESLKSQSLPLDRCDVLTQDVDVIRVFLAAAVQFIINLEVKENIASPKTNNELAIDISL